MGPAANWRNALAVLALASACAGRDPELGPGWSRGPGLPEPIQENHAAVLHGRIYTAGGFHFGSVVSAAVFRLDSPAGRWERVATLPAPRHHMPLAVAGDSLYANRRARAGRPSGCMTSGTIGGWSGRRFPRREVRAPSASSMVASSLSAGS